MQSEVAKIAAGALALASSRWNMLPRTENSERGLVGAELQSRQNRCALHLDCFESVRIESQYLQDCGSHLLGFHKLVIRILVDVRIGYQKHHLGVVVGEAAVLGLLCGAPRIDYAHVRRDDDIRRA